MYKVCPLTDAIQAAITMLAHAHKGETTAKCFKVKGKGQVNDKTANSKST